MIIFKSYDRHTSFVGMESVRSMIEDAKILEEVRLLPQRGKSRSNAENP